MVGVSNKAVNYCWCGRHTYLVTFVDLSYRFCHCIRLGYKKSFYDIWLISRNPNKNLKIIQISGGYITLHVILSVEQTPQQTQHPDHLTVVSLCHLVLGMLDSIRFWYYWSELQFRRLCLLVTFSALSVVYLTDHD